MTRENKIYACHPELVEGCGEEEKRESILTSYFIQKIPHNILHYIVQACVVGRQVSRLFHKWIFSQKL